MGGRSAARKGIVEVNLEGAMELLEKIGMVKSAEKKLMETISTAEVTALIKYASEHGIGAETNELSDLTDALYNFHKDKTIEAHKLVLKNYTSLVRLTKPKHGRILLENSRTYMYMKAPIVLTIVLIVLMATSEVLGNWLADQPEPEGGWLWRIFIVQRYVLDYLAPFLWGAIGACVYLLKHLYDIARDGSFDSTKFHGWYIRVILGSILGGVVYYLYNIDEIDENSVNIDAKALAFFTGVGVKVIYGGIERTILLIGEKLNLDAVRRARQDQPNLILLLDEEIKGTDQDNEPEKYRILTALRDKAEGQSEG